MNCGMCYERDALQSMLTQGRNAEPAPTPARQNGQAKADELAAGAERLVERHQYDEAEKEFRALAEQCPEDWRGWWGLFLVQMETLRFSSMDDFMENEKYAQNAFALAGPRLDVIRMQYEGAWDEFWKVLETEKK